jgi:RNA polymerase sigma-70 factor, ECF subfamily
MMLAKQMSQNYMHKQWKNCFRLPRSSRHFTTGGKMDEGQGRSLLAIQKRDSVAFSARVMENTVVSDSRVGPEYSFIECSKYLQDNDECSRLEPRVSVKVSQRSRDMVLTQRAQAGDAEAFCQLLTNYRARIFTLVYSIVRNEHDACDLVQEVLLKAWQSIDRFENRSSLYTWLYRLAMNVTICSLRRKRLCQEIELSDDIPSLLPGPSINCQRNEIQDCVAAAVGRLSPKLRAVIELKELQGLQYQEIAETLNLPIGTVMSRLFSARKRLQSLLGAVYEPYQQDH